LIVDDHQIIIDGIRSILGSEDKIEIAGEANNGQEALDLLALVGGDLVLLDLDMPVLNGIETTRSIKRNHPHVKVIILSMHFENGLVRKLLELNIDGYILKNADKEELLHAINKVINGGRFFSQEITLSLAGKHFPSNTTNPNDTRHLTLTERESEILTLIAGGLSNKEIGLKLHISHRTVDTHRTNLMKKIGVSNIAGLIRYAMKQGYISQ